jgi:hypothetical protein
MIARCLPEFDRDSRSDPTVTDAASFDPRRGRSSCHDVAD